MVFNPRDRFLISVIMPTDGTVVQIEVKAALIVRYVKSIIENKVGHTMDDTDLFYGKLKLDDLKVLYQYDIKEHSILKVVPGTLQIFIKKWCGSGIMLHVQRHDLVQNVKGMLLKKLGIPVHLQKLVFEGKCLADSRDLASYNIQNYSSISLDFCNYFEHPTPLSIQRRPLSNIQSNCLMNLCTVTGVPSSLSSTAVIAHLKPLIENVLKLVDYGLIKRSKTLIRNVPKLVDYVLIKNSTLHASVKGSVPRILLVKRAYAEDTLRVYSRINDTIQNVKSRIGAKERINSNNFSLIHDGKFLEDDKTLAFLNIAGGSTLHMVFNPRDKFLISVIMPTGRTVQIEVKAALIVCDVKSVIESKVGHMDDMDLFFGEQELEDWKVLYHYDIKENSILEVVSGNIQISIRTLCRRIMLDVQRHDLVKNVKGMLEKKLGIPVHLQNLVFDGNCLDDSRDLASYNIGKDSNVLLIFLIPLPILHRSSRGDISETVI